MIDALDLVLRKLFLTRVPGLADSRIGFQPPDEAWRQLVGGAPSDMHLNCYLVELREDRRLRQGVRERVGPGPHVIDRRAPVQVRCQYLVSAWHGSRNSLQMQATEREHATLGAVMSALLAATPLVPSRLLTPTELKAVPEPLRERPLSLEPLPGEGFPKLAEFWGTMGRPIAWRPVVPLVVTAPLFLPETPDAVVVQSVSASYQVLPDGSADVLELPAVP
ncbi:MULTISPECIES: Pvc16 family protein [Streptomyces]|uniref:Pvc16 family protein n=2 Tax=Streptomyces TaxID=1883 RepID=A0ABU4K1N3_9ACTN|nr:Pvc16 family protein [Streptomyces roseolus]MDX2291663.1 Pvc16 family protein [Streptomyces roseolus]